MSHAGLLAPGVAPFPDYCLLAPIGKGGWGEVWKARDSRGNFVALKFIPCDSRLSAAHEVRALQTIKHLSHRGITRIDQVWCWSGYIVIAMELAEGSMLDLLDQYCTDYGTCIIPEHLCQFLTQAAEAVDFLNERQHLVDGQRFAVRHCDIKPSNLLVFEEQIKLADFSLAVMVAGPMLHQVRVGTLAYAAPEIFRGFLSDRSDLYALAVSYIELRTGKLPFIDTPHAFSRTYVRPEPDLSMLSPPERPILHRALAPVPQDRWRNCREMMERLAKATRQVGVPC
jgi:serine/threonine protein kinase, bacterial